MSDFEATEAARGSLRAVRFSFTHEGERVPGALWLPAEAAGPLPLVLIQHPGMGSKDDGFVSGPAQGWALAHGWACAGIDAPGHGERLSGDPLEALRDPERGAAMVRQFAGEVHATVDELLARYPLDADRLGYFGYSLGAMLGVPAVAGDGRFRAAVFAAAGTGGLVGPAEGPESVVPKLAGVAVRVAGKSADELIPLESTQALYHALPGTKDLRWFPGNHFMIGADVIDAAEEWLVEHL